MAFIVCSALNRVNIKVVLSGGGAATIWSEDEYQSRDCDFIFTFNANNATVKETMESLGFQFSNGSFINPHCPFYVEFPPGPLAIGNEIITKWETLNDSHGQILHILSATDSCRDRLAAFYFWNDYTALAAAVAIARGNELDFALIKRWSKNEDAVRKYKMFIEHLRIETDSSDTRSST